MNSSYSRKLINGKVTATAGIHNIDNLNMTYYGLGSNRFEVLKAINKTQLFRWCWYAIFLIMGVVCLVLEPKSWFYCIDLYVLLINIDLVTQGKTIGIYIGIIECLLYAVMCFQSGLYGELIKMFTINIPLNIAAIVNWTKDLRKQKKNKYSNATEENNSVTIRKLKKSSYIWIVLAFGALYVGSYFGLKLLNTSALIFSAGALVCSIFNKILNGMRYKESWIFSIINNVICVGMWIQILVAGSANGGVNLVELPALMSTFAALSNGFYGYIIWKSMYRKIAVNGGEILAMRKIKINKIIKLRRQYQKLIWDKKIDMERNS